MVPDVMYPWDPAVVRSIRSFCPDAFPITVRSMWKRSAAEQDAYQTMTLVRHGIARAIRDPIGPTHHFYCHMPTTTVLPGTLSTPAISPNYIEVNWYDKERREFGYDLPGAYLPFDWEFHACLRAGYEDNLSPKDLYHKLADPYFERKAKRERDAAESVGDPEFDAWLEGRVRRASDPEIKQVLLGDAELPEEIKSYGPGDVSFDQPPTTAGGRDPAKAPTAQGASV
jgi:hypothetical protein